jgi:hypothetical protein
MKRKREYPWGQNGCPSRCIDGSINPGVRRVPKKEKDSKSGSESSKGTLPNALIITAANVAAIKKLKNAERFWS